MCCLAPGAAGLMAAAPLHGARQIQLGAVRSLLNIGQTWKETIDTFIYLKVSTILYPVLSCRMSRSVEDASYCKFSTPPLRCCYVSSMT